ncbi:MAG: NTP transferase domain-containing protein, partial [Elusimicrobia bacterium]|nr:NTP transferase domain-containing protein [Elusimicrobiota bacterium]
MTRPEFVAGVIAAGEGSRLARHAPLVKPLIPVAGRPLAHWVVDGLKIAGARRVTVLTNSRGGDVPPSLSAAFPGLPFDFTTADTASSFESFRLVARRLARDADSFLISTVDALITPSEVARFLAECRAARADAGLALTRFVDDEKPLWADVGQDGLVTAVGDRARSLGAVTCGLYYLTAATAALLPEAGAHAR